MTDHAKPVCCIDGCGSPAGYTNFEGDAFCWQCADGDRPAPPKDENGAGDERATLLDRIRETNQAYDKVRETLDAMRTALYDAEATLNRAARPNPAIIRQAALSEAWDALLAAGHVAAGNVIANMLREDRLKDGADR